MTSQLGYYDVMRHPIILRLGVIFFGGRGPRFLYTAENNEGNSFESLNLNYIQSSVFIVLFPLTYDIAGL